MMTTVNGRSQSTNMYKQICKHLTTTVSAKPMDRVMLHYAKLAISRCLSNVITSRQQALGDIVNTLLHRPTAVDY